MRAIQTNQTKLILLSLLLLFSLTGCWGLIGPDQYSEHDFKVVNETEEMIWVEYHTENRIVGSRTGYSGVDFVFTDSAFVLAPGESQEVMQLQFRDFERYRLDESDVNRRIVSLDLFHIDNTDTLPIQLDHLMENNWDYENNDPLPFSYQIFHYYDLRVLPEHID